MTTTTPRSMRCDRCTGTTPCDCAPPVVGDVPPLDQAACDLIQAALDGRDPYMNDRPYPQPQDWADGANPFARPHPNLPWIHRGLPVSTRASLTDYGVDVGHEGAVHDFPHPPCTVVATGTKPGQWGSAVDRPERIA